jgi:hypothetical protein
MPIYTITRGHRELLNILVQFACPVAMAPTKEPYEFVPENLKDLMGALQEVDANPGMVSTTPDVIIWTPALKFVATNEPGLFPKTIARTILHRLRKDSTLWNIARTVDGLDLKGIDADDPSSWERMLDRTPHAVELFIAPQPFRRILDAFEAQEQEGLLAQV